jgi:hypothetical protein
MLDIILLIIIFTISVISLGSWIWFTFFNYWVYGDKKEGKETWFKTMPYAGYRIEGSEYSKSYVQYERTRKITGKKETIKKYLN